MSDNVKSQKCIWANWWSKSKKKGEGCFFKENLEASAMAAKNQNLSVDKWRNLRIYSSNLNKIVEIRTANRFIFKRALAFIKKS